MKWPYVSPNQRRSVTETLTDATEAMLITDDRSYELEEIRRALRTWAFSARLRGVKNPPDDIAPIAQWLETGTIKLAHLAQAGEGAVRSRAELDRISRKQDGKLAAANAANRKRAVLNNGWRASSDAASCWVNVAARAAWNTAR